MVPSILLQLFKQPSSGVGNQSTTYTVLLQCIYVECWSSWKAFSSCSQMHCSFLDRCQVTQHRNEEKNTHSQNTTRNSYWRPCLLEGSQPCGSQLLGPCSIDTSNKTCGGDPPCRIWDSQTGSAQHSVVTASGQRYALLSWPCMAFLPGIVSATWVHGSWPYPEEENEHSSLSLLHLKPENHNFTIITYISNPYNNSLCYSRFKNPRVEL